jgi:hypothetical protein
LPPLAPAVSATEATVLEAERRPMPVHAPLSAPPPARASANAPKPARFPWLFLFGVGVMLSGAAALTYYALFVNMPSEQPPPPLPSSVGSARPSASADAAIEPSGVAAEAGVVAMLPADCPGNAALCACCPSGRECGGSCDDWVEAGEHFRLRPGAFEMDTAEGAAQDLRTEICVRASNQQDAEKCTALSELAGAGVAVKALELDGLDLVQTGVDIAVYQRWLSEVPIARAALKRPVRRSELCKGIPLGERELTEPGPLRRLVLYLDSSAGDAGSRCRGAASPPP